VKTQDDFENIEYEKTTEYLEKKFGKEFTENQNGSQWDYYFSRADKNAAKRWVRYLSSLLSSAKKDPKLSGTKFDLYPTKWMLKDKMIMANLKRHKLFFPILNTIYNYDRYYKTLNVDPILSDKDYPCFICDGKFYKDLSDEIGHSVVAIKKYIWAMRDAGFFKFKFALRHNVPVLTDAIYSSTENHGVRKIAFIKNAPEYREELKNFCPK
jgi:hypothetical protein